VQRLLHHRLQTAHDLSQFGRASLVTLSLHDRPTLPLAPCFACRRPPPLPTPLQSVPLTGSLNHL
jgi:hypothetical protein